MANKLKDVTIITVQCDGISHDEEV